MNEIELKEHLADLSSSDPSVRFSALMGLDKADFTDETLKIFERCCEAEKDEGIRFHMQKLMRSLNRPSMHNKSSAELIAAELLRPDKDEINLALMLESVKRSDAKEVLTALRQAEWFKLSARLLPSVLKFLKKYGQMQDAVGASKLCLSKDAGVAIAAVEALEKLNPEGLKQFIAPLLVSANFAVRSRAVRALHRFDPSEAKRHFEAMLFSNKLTERQAALYHAFFFPFNEIENVMLKFLAVEPSMPLIKKAALVFIANPNTQAPSRLVELRAAASGERKKLVDAVLKGVLLSLYKAKLVNAEPEKMLKILEAHFFEKRIKLSVEQHKNLLASQDKSIRLRSALKLAEIGRRKLFDTSEILKNYLSKLEGDEQNRVIVKFYIKNGQALPESKAAAYISGQKPTAEAATSTPSNKTPLSPHTGFADMQESEQIAFIEAISDANAFEKAFLQVEPALEAASAPVKAAAARCIGHFNQTKYEQLLLSFLESGDAELLTASIEALSRVNPDLLCPLLPKLIKHKSDEVKQAAIEVFALFDKASAVSLLSGMIRSIRPANRRVAIFCLSAIDYASVNSIVISAIKAEDDPDNFEQLISIVRANADKDAFFELYALTKNDEAEKASKLSKALNSIAEAIAEGEQGITKEQLYNEANKLYEAEKQKQNERGAYNLEKIQKIRSQTEAAGKTDDSLVRFTIITAMVGAVLTAIIWFGFLAPKTSARKSNFKNQSHFSGSKYAKKRRIRSISISGTVCGADEKTKTIAVETAGNKTYYFKLPNSLGVMPRVGEAISALIKADPTERGSIDAELIRLQ